MAKNVSDYDKLAFMVKEMGTKYTFYYNMALLINKVVVPFLVSPKNDILAMVTHKDMPILYVSKSLFARNENIAHGVLVHEILHVVMKHHSRIENMILQISSTTGINQEIVYYLTKDIFNIAADIAINPYIPELKEEKYGLFPNTAEAMVGFKLPKEGSSFEDFFWSIYNGLDYQKSMSDMAKELEKIINQMQNSSGNSKAKGQKKKDGSSFGKGSTNGKETEGESKSSNGKGNKDNSGNIGDRDEIDEERKKQRKYDQSVKQIRKKHLKKRINDIIDELKKMSRSDEIIILKPDKISNKSIRKENNQSNAYIREAWVNTDDKGRGSVPGDIAEKVNQMINPPKISFSKWIRDKASYSLHRKEIPSFQHYDKRFGIIPGKKRVSKGKIVIAIDTSGSMDKNDLALALGVLNSFSKKADVISVDIDTKVNDVKKLNRRSIRSYTFKGRGGTDFDDFFDLVTGKKLKGNKTRKIKKWYKLVKDPSLIVFFTDTDGSCSYKQKDIGSTVLWITNNTYISSEVRRFGSPVVVLAKNDYTVVMPGQKSEYDSYW